MPSWCCCSIRQCAKQQACEGDQRLPVGGSVMITRYSVRFWGILESISELGHLYKQAQSPAGLSDRGSAAISVLQIAALGSGCCFTTGWSITATSTTQHPALGTVDACSRMSCGAWLAWKKYLRKNSKSHLMSLMISYARMRCARSATRRSWHTRYCFLACNMPAI